MNESQSRYSIMENMSKRKTDAQNRVSAMERDMILSEINVNKRMNELRQSIDKENRTYKQNFLDWKKENEVRLDFRKKEVERELAKMKEDIVSYQNNYENEHKKKVDAMENELKEHTENFANFKKIKEMEMVAIREEIKEIDTAISSLKEVSKNSKNE